VGVGYHPKGFASFFLIHMQQQETGRDLILKAEKK
jgi:hypothetical protein